MFDKFKIPWDLIEKELETKVEEVFLKVFETIEDTEKDIIRLRERHPNLNEAALCNELINETSKITAVIGGGAALPDLIPGFGWAAMIASLTADFGLTLREEMGMLLKFSFLFEPDTEITQRKKDVISLLVFLARDKKNNAFAKEVLEDISRVQFDAMGRKILIRIGVQLGLKFFRKKLFALFPGIGIVLSGGVNFLGTRQAGRLGIEFFQNKAEFLRRNGSSTVNLEITQRATIQMMINLSKMGESQVTEASLQKIEDLLDIFGYSEDEKAAFRKDLEKKEITPIALSDIRKLGTEDKRYVLKQGIKLVGKASAKQDNYLEFINRAFGLTPSDMKQIRDEITQENQP